MHPQEQKPRTCDECEELVKEMADVQGRVQVLETGHARMKEAFIKNDLGIPDFDGHRVSHYNAVEQAKVVKGYTQDMTKKVLEWLLVAVAVLIGQGALEWIRGHLK